MVALLEDSYIMRRQIYDKVFEELNIYENSEEANYIKAHIDVPVSQEEREKVINSVNMLFNTLRL
jgi:hypothetical protein